MGYELNDFQKDVIEASNSTPVVIDFWAEWCGPCRQLGPVIEKLAGEAGDRWNLVKVNTDRHPDIAVQFNVRGIPAVKMVYQKQIIAEFTGAQPEHRVRQWLEDNLPENGQDESGELQNRVKVLLGGGKRKEARELLEDHVDDDSPQELKVKLAMLLLPDEMNKAEEWLSPLEDELKYEIEMETLETVKHLKKIHNGEITPESDHEQAAEHYRKGAEALFNLDFDSALRHFIQSLQLDRSLDDDGARKACIAGFTMLGEQHPFTQQYRRQFSMSLY